MRLHRWIIGILCVLPVAAHAQSDWIDELPTVTSVAHAVTDQLKVDTAKWRFEERGVALKDDDDLYAVYMVGTFMLLRQIILYKYQEEATLTPERQAKLRNAVASYLEAELLIGRGIGKRRGYLTTAQKCRDLDCHRRWFKLGVHGVLSASYRARILKQLFCDPERATELDRLAQSYATRAPYMRSPAETLTVEPEFAGVAAAGCDAYGGDADRNGLCDNWRNTPQNPPLTSTSACGAAMRPHPLELSCGKVVAETRWVQVKTGVRGRQGDQCETKSFKFKDCEDRLLSFQGPSGPGCSIEDGISIHVKCASGHVVQFISREFWKRGTPDSQEPDHNLEKGCYGAAPYAPDPGDPSVSIQACYKKTDNLKQRNWRTDSLSVTQTKKDGDPYSERCKDKDPYYEAGKNKDPYYEVGGSYVVSRDSMTTLDAPNAPGFDPQRYLVARIVGKSFAVCECKVVAVVDWQREYDAGKQRAPFYADIKIRDPDPAEIEKFQSISTAQDFQAWPFAEEECSKCAR